MINILFLDSASAWSYPRRYRACPSRRRPCAVNQSPRPRFAKATKFFCGLSKQHRLRFRKPVQRYSSKGSIGQSWFLGRLSDATQSVKEHTMNRSSLDKTAIAILSVLSAIILGGCHPGGGQGGGTGGTSSTGRVAIAFACEYIGGQDSTQTCYRSFKYSLTPGQLTGSSGQKTAYSGSQDQQMVGNTTTINGNGAGIFSWSVPPSFAFGTWTLNMTATDERGGNAIYTTQVVMSSNSPTVEVHCDNLTTGVCQTGDPNLATYP